MGNAHGVFLFQLTDFAAYSLITQIIVSLTHTPLYWTKGARIFRCHLYQNIYCVYVAHKSTIKIVHIFWNPFRPLVVRCRFVCCCSDERKSSLLIAWFVYDNRPTTMPLLYWCSRNPAHSVLHKKHFITHHEFSWNRIESARRSRLYIHVLCLKWIADWWYGEIKCFKNNSKLKKHPTESISDEHSQKVITG